MSIDKTKQEILELIDENIRLSIEIEIINIKERMYNFLSNEVTLIEEEVAEIKTLSDKANSIMNSKNPLTRIFFLNKAENILVDGSKRLVEVEKRLYELEGLLKGVKSLFENP